MKSSVLFRFFLALTMALIATLGVKAQRLDSTLAVYAQKYQSERTYLHYDKSSYFPGETIWFKAYLMEGIFPAEESKTFYIDWVDDQGKVLSHTVSPVVDAVTSGQFDVPDSYKGNFIHVRAYTKWMLNFDSSFHYQKDIRILAKAKPTAPADKNVANTTIHFFPEGGEIISGIRNKIAFKATDEWGNPVKLKGSVQSNTGTFVDSLRTLHDGMGFFFLQPEAGKTYAAKWIDEKKAQHTTPLPASKPEGLAMQVSLAGTKRQIIVTRTDNTPSLNTVHLVGTMQQQMVFKADIDLSASPGATRVIPTEMLPSGIVVITLFDGSWNAVAERVTFINNHEYSFPAELNVEHWGLSKRARNEIQIKIPDSIVTNLSIAITDAAIEKDTNNTIISHLLLTSDLKGKVHNPAYYFSGKEDLLQQHLDLVMLTNGWRRFKWENIVKGKLPQISYPRDTSYLALSGKLYGMPQGGLKNGNSLIMFVKEKDSSSKMVMMPVSANGSFADPEFVFFDTLQVYTQPTKSLNGADMRFMENRLSALNYASRKNVIPYLLNDTAGSFRHYQLADENARLFESVKGKTLETVIVKGTTKSPVQVLDEKYASGLFKSGDGYQFDLVNDQTSMGAMNIFSYLQGRVAGLQINATGGNVSMQWRGGTPEVFLDEIRTDASMISSVPISDIAYVKVFRPPFIGAIGGGSGGAIAIYTRKGNDMKPSPEKGLNSHVVTGYTPIREFYAPNYSTFNLRNEQRDLRTTLYWNPNLTTAPKKSVIRFSFYNNDVSQAFRVVLEGMSKDGQLIHLEQILE